MKLLFSEQAWEDYLYWQKHDRKLLQRINELIRALDERAIRIGEGGTQDHLLQPVGEAAAGELVLKAAIALVIEKAGHAGARPRRSPRMIADPAGAGHARDRARRGKNPPP